MISGHSCALAEVSDSCLEHISSDAGILHRLRRTLIESILVTNRHPNFQTYYKSRQSLLRERKRHLAMGRPLMIHPISSFRFYWEIWMSLILGASLIACPLQVAFDNHSEGGWFYDSIVILTCIMDVHFMVDVVLHFFTGYITDTKEVVLQFPRIAKHYLQRCFIIDLISSLPTCLIFHRFHHVESATFEICMVSLFKILRLPSCLNYTRSTFNMINVSESVYMMFRQFIVAVILTHWTTCLFYIIPMWKRYRQGDWHPHSWVVQAKIHDQDVPMAVKYVTCLYRAVSHVYCADGGILKTTTTEDIIFSCTAFILGKFYFAYLFVMMLQLTISLFSSESKYLEVMNQLQDYMRSKKLPLTMQNRVISYYDYRYHNSYFREQAVFSVMPDHIKQELNLYCSKKIIQRVDVFKELPIYVLRDIISNLKQEVFMPNDIIVKAGTAGDCMYFLRKGTVAVYTANGKEVCHLQDGAYFGEIALLMKDRKRISTIIALEICETYRLDRKYFRRSFSANIELFQKFEKIANERMERTIIAEQVYRTFINRNSDTL